MTAREWEGGSEGGRERERERERERRIAMKRGAGSDEFIITAMKRPSLLRESVGKASGAGEKSNYHVPPPPPAPLCNAQTA